MPNFEELGLELQRRGKTEKLRALAESEDGARLAAMVDTNKLEQAAKAGDAAALRALLSRALQSDEGQRLAAGIRKLME